MCILPAIEMQIKHCPYSEGGMKAGSEALD